MQIKTTMKYYFIPPTMAYNQSVPKDIEKLEPLNTADESAQWYDHSEISLAVFHKFTIQLDNAT